MKLLLAATLVLMMSAIAIAVPDSQQLGPYAVSFDIDANYQAQIAQPMVSETANAYEMRIFVDNSSYAAIGIAESVEPSDATLQVLKSLIPMSMIIQQGLNVTGVDDMEIDGKEGFLVTSVPFQSQVGAPSIVYKAMYWLDSEKCECGPVSVGKTSVIITSTFPQDVTESLLSTLQIVKGEATPSDSGGQIQPPA